MFDQLLLGSAITLVSLVVGASLWWALNAILLWMEPWLRRPPRQVKSLVIILMVVCSTMFMITFGVWLWAIVFRQIGAFSTLEEAVYYSLVAYTTLGLGDVVVPQEQRLLGGMTGSNGFLMFGLMTAMVTDTLRDVRVLHQNSRDQNVEDTGVSGR
ncbi:two pore domain potassium channel family protein [Roseovarius gahaiensis]|uniref:Two pore domain potassium channel family protein n=1 Tax=Roseovarius gahaiensis TaxID=2716691 RepID=A0A967BGY9_9RHOB|nr:two pore domain potassium channel family protein [Roseovarius gahaiensis]NHQ76046.1 two pore domain potassium channel family protein [Roseovarius gahaiensis]